MNENVNQGGQDGQGGQGGQQGQQGQQNAAGWLDGMPDELKGVAESKGWKGTEDALRSYQELEGLFGMDKANRTLAMPKDEGDAEALGKIYNALGRPDKADGYGFGEMFKGQELNQTFVDTMSKSFHEAGLSKSQAGKIAKAYNDIYFGEMAAQESAYKAEQEAYEQKADPEKLEMARRGFRLFGLPQEEMADVSRSIERALGMEKAVELFAALGRKIGEDSRVNGESVLSPTSAAGAERRMSERMADKIFMDRYLAGDKTALGEMEELARMAAKGRG